jgi:hypothetical protein
MSRYLVAFGLLACASAGLASDEASNTNAALARQSVEEVVRVETRAGSFLVRESCAQEVRQALAGEATEHPIFADIQEKLDVATHRDFIENWRR